MSVYDQPHFACPICGNPMPEKWTESSGGGLRPVCNECFRANYRLGVLERILADPEAAKGAQALIDQLVAEHPLLQNRVPCETPAPKPRAPRPDTRAATRKAAILEELDLLADQTRNELRRKLKMNDDTCQRLLDELKAEGLIRDHQGNGKTRSKKARVWIRVTALTPPTVPPGR